jgi:hypothetical protein
VLNLSNKVKILDLLKVFNGSWVFSLKKKIKHPQYSLELCLLRIHNFSSMAFSLNHIAQKYQGSAIHNYSPNIPFNFFSVPITRD